MRRMIVATVSLLIVAMAPSPSAVARPDSTKQSYDARTLQFATWNFCNQTCPDWDRRLRAFTRTVAATTPDVLAVQEVDTRDQGLARTVTALRPYGYVEADPQIHRTCPGGCESHLLVRSSAVRVVPPTTPKRGPDYAGVVPPGVLPTRARGNPVTFAFLEHRSTGARVLALSLHLEKQNGTGLNGPDDRARNAAVAALARWSVTRSSELGMAGTPTLLMGDFNSYPRKQPNGPHRVLQQLGYRNTEKARTTIGDQYATVNKTPADARWNGFPPRPRVFPLGGPRIDGILTKGLPTARRYQVYVRTRSDGRFDERYRASDHNLVRAWISLPQ